MAVMPFDLLSLYSSHIASMLNINMLLMPITKKSCGLPQITVKKLLKFFYYTETYYYSLFSFLHKFSSMNVVECVVIQATYSKVYCSTQ